MKFSIIVPAYNVAQYIVKCLESILNQDYKNFEIIVIDDGATDETPQILDEFASKSEKVRVIHQRNGGLSSARNSGIKTSTGDYILFLDGDDFWSDHTFLSVLHQKIIENPVDVIIYSYSYYYPDKVLNKQLNSIGFSGKIDEDYINLVKHELITAPAWNKCVKKSLFEKNNLDFPVGFLSEDCLWCANLLKEISTFSVLDNSQYMYRQNREGSITNIIKEKNILDILKSISIGLENINDFSSIKKEALNIYFSISYISILPFVNAHKNNVEIKRYLNDFAFLLKYSRQIENKSFKYSGVVARIIGVENAVVLFGKLLGLYKKFKS